jgi:branched-chain amino acid transport system substrate-binding protein
MGASLLTGMRLYLDEVRQRAGAPPVRLRAQTLRSGTALVRRQVEEVVQQSGARYVVGMVNTRVAAQLQGVLEASGAVFVNVTVGENIQRAGDWRRNVFQISLAQWQANWALGDRAARTLGRKAWVASSFYDSGYDALHAFRLAFEAAGGHVVGTSVSHLPSRAPHAARVEETVAEMAAARPDVVFAGYSGPAAADLLRAYHSSPLAGRVPLLGSAFLMDEQLLAEQAAPPAAVLTALSWDQASVRQSAPAFCAAYQERIGCAIDSFGVLGYEAAALICQAAAAPIVDAVPPADIPLALSEAVLISPRGRVAMDPQTHTASAPLYLREVHWEAGALHSATIGALPPISELDSRVAQWRGSHKSGWLDAYLCV